MSLICLPGEVEELSRRRLLRAGVSLTAYVSLARLLGLASPAMAQTGTMTMTGTGTGTGTTIQTSYPPARKLVWISLDGGWDILEATDPKPASTAGIDMVYPISQASPVAGATDGTVIGRWLPNIAAIGQDLLVVRGLAMGTTSHPAGKTYVDTSVLSPTGMVNSASIPAIVASESTATIPIIQLPGGTDPQTDRGLLKPISVVRADNLDLYRSMYPTDDAAIQRHMAVLDFLKSSVARVQAEVGTNDRLTDLGNAEEKVRVQFQGNVGAKLTVTDQDRATFSGPPKGVGSDVVDTTALALKLLNNELVTCVNVGFGGFDTHQNQTARLQPVMAEVDFLVSRLVAGLKASGKLDSTLIILHSDFGRTPKVNAANGRDHWPVGGALVIGGGIAGGRSVGATADDTLAAADLIDPESGAVTTDSAKGVQLNPTHIGGLALALTLGSAYMSFRPYLSVIPALTRLKGG